MKCKSSLSAPFPPPLRSSDGAAPTSQASKDSNKKGRSALWAQPRGLLQSAPQPPWRQGPRTKAIPGRAGQNSMCRRNCEAAQDSRLWARGSAHWFSNGVLWRVSNRTRKGQRLASATDTPGTGSPLRSTFLTQVSPAQGPWGTMWSVSSRNTAWSGEQGSSDSS